MNFKLGSKPAKRDERNFKMEQLLAAAKSPASYDFDKTHKGIPLPMFGNDRYGDCVIAGRAHQTLRFEDAEQNKVISITEKEVLDEYFKESGGSDTGLYILDSLKAWRKGWTAAGKTYKIKAFAEIDPKNHDLVKNTMSSDIGIYIGMAMPDNWQDALDKGKPWTDVSQPMNESNGHCVFLPAYTKTYLTCVTWGMKQEMNWKWWDKYVTEAYGVIDAKNTKINQLRLDMMLEEVLGM